MYRAALARTTAPSVRSTASDASPGSGRRIAGAGGIHRGRQRAGSSAPRAVAPPRVHLPRRPFGRLVVVARGAGVGDTEAGGGLRHRRLERVIAAPHQQPPVDVAHVAVHTAAAGGVGGVERVAGELRHPSRDRGSSGPSAGRLVTRGRRAAGAAPATRHRPAALVALRARAVADRGRRCTFTLSENGLARAVREVAVGAGDAPALKQPDSVSACGRLKRLGRPSGQNSPCASNSGSGSLSRNGSAWSS